MMISLTSFAQTKGKDFTITQKDIQVTHVGVNLLDILEEVPKYSWSANWDTYQLITTRDTLDIIAAGERENGALLVDVEGKLTINGTTFYEGDYQVIFSANNSEEVICQLPSGNSVAFQTEKAHRDMLATFNIIEKVDLDNEQSLKIKFTGLVGAVFKDDTLNFQFFAPDDKITMLADFKNRTFKYDQKGDYPDQSDYKILKAYKHPDKLELIVEGKCSSSLKSTDKKTMENYTYDGEFTIWLFKETEFSQYIFPDGVGIYLLSSEEREKLMKTD